MFPAPINFPVCYMQKFSLVYHSIYVRNWRVLGAIWVLCALSTTVLQILVLIHPTWIGNDEGGYFGLYDYCASNECGWAPFRIRPLSFSFELSALLVLSSTVLSVLAVFSIMMLVLFRDRYVFLLSSWMHLFSFVSMLGGCLMYPNGWEHPRVREICESKKYNLGLCQLRWPYILACVLVFDQLSLALLGFVLACKQPPKISELQPFTRFESTGIHGVQPVPRPRKLSLQDTYYSNSGSRMEL